MKQFLKNILLAALLFATAFSGRGQGFINLNFESANSAAMISGLVSTNNAIPGWTAYINGSQVSQILYNTLNLDEPAVTIQGTNSPSLMPIQGGFSVLLQGGTQYAYATNSSIGQTGQIPLTAKSLIFWGGDEYVSFNGQALSIVMLGVGSTPYYNIYGADISAFAGQTGQLLFTAPKLTGAIIDNIQFSTTAVPEPSTLALFGFGAVMLGVRRLFSGA